MFGSGTNKLQDSLFQLKFAAKQVTKLSEKAQHECELQKQKLKKALASGNVDCGRIYAENAIRKHNESLSYLRMASRFDAVQSRVQSALTMNQVVKNIGSVSKELEKAMKSMDMEKLEKIMSKFESQFEDLDVRSSTMESSMGNAFTLSTPEHEVNALMKQPIVEKLRSKHKIRNILNPSDVAEENGLEIADAVAGAPVVSGSVGIGSSTATEDDALTRRLAQLRN